MVSTYYINSFFSLLFLLIYSLKKSFNKVFIQAHSKENALNKCGANFAM